MKLKNLSKILFSLILLLLSGCASIEIPDVNVCGVTGTLDNGMMCVTSLSDSEYEMNFNESLDFLQANEEHGAALCLSSAHWVELKNALESACYLLGEKRCKKKVEEKINSVVRSIERIQDLTN